MTPWLTALLAVSCMVACVVGAYQWARASEIQRAAREAADVHRRYVEFLLTSHTREIERLANAMRHGMPEIPQATELPRQADTEERLARRIDESRVVTMNQAIENGMDTLRKLYRADGIGVSEEQLREEATRMVQGLPPQEGDLRPT